MYLIAGSTGTLGTAIANELSSSNSVHLIGRDESKLSEQSKVIGCEYTVLDLNNTPEPREFAKILIRWASEGIIWRNKMHKIIDSGVELHPEYIT